MDYGHLKTVAFIAGKKREKPQKSLFVFPLKISLQTSVCNLYALKWPKWNFGCYLTFEIIF